MDLVPALHEVKSSRSRAGGLQIMMVPHPRSKYPSSIRPLDRFRDSYLGIRHEIWAEIPQELIVKGSEKGWLRIIRQCKSFLINKCAL